MRETTEAFSKFVWAMSTLGVQQMLGLFGVGGRESGGRPAADGMDDLSRAMECRLGEVLGELFRTGDRAQRSMTDMLFRAAPGRGPAGGDCGCGGGGPPAGDQTGWGPMPPA